MWVYFYMQCTFTDTDSKPIIYMNSHLEVGVKPRLITVIVLVTNVIILILVIINEAYCEIKKTIAMLVLSLCYLFGLAVHQLCGSTPRTTPLSPIEPL